MARQHKHGGSQCHYGFDVCARCGREINRNTHGAFRRHAKPGGGLCPGSWEWPFEQKKTMEEERAVGATLDK